MSDYERYEEMVITRLKKIREQKQLSQLELSYRSGVSQNMIAYIESRKRTPTLTTLIKLCTALNVNPAVLFEDEKKERDEVKKQVLDLISRYM